MKETHASEENVKVKACLSVVSANKQNVRTQHMKAGNKALGR